MALLVYFFSFQYNPLLEGSCGEGTGDAADRVGNSGVEDAESESGEISFRCRWREPGWVPLR